MDDSAIAILHDDPNGGWPRSFSGPGGLDDLQRSGPPSFAESNASGRPILTCCGDGASSPVLPQVVEIKDGSGDTTDQFVWGPAYVDELLMHERDADGDPNNVLEQRLYAAHDTLYSVLRLVDEDGNVVEQYSYSPYGADPTDPRSSLPFVYCNDLMRV